MHLFPMFLLGEYYQDEAREIADKLKEVGMKVDIRTFTASRLEVFHFLEGRMSLLKGRLEEKEYARYEQYLASLRKVLAEGAGPDDLAERLEKEMDPQIDEKRNRLKEMLKADFSGDETDVGSFAAIKDDAMNMYLAESFIDTLLDRNDFQVGDDSAAKLDDPIIRVAYDGPSPEQEGELIKTTTSFTIEPRAQVFVDEFYAVLAEELDEEFEEEFDQEYMRLVFLGKLITDLKEA